MNMILFINKTQLKTISKKCILHIKQLNVIEKDYLKNIKYELKNTINIMLHKKVLFILKYNIE